MSGRFSGTAEEKRAGDDKSRNRSSRRCHCKAPPALRRSRRKEREALTKLEVAEFEKEGGGNSISRVAADEVARRGQ